MCSDLLWKQPVFELRRIVSKFVAGSIARCPENKKQGRRTLLFNELDLTPKSYLGVKKITPFSNCPGFTQLIDPTASTRIMGSVSSDSSFWLLVI